jgi:hypothetical protein
MDRDEQSPVPDADLVRTPPLGIRNIIGIVTSVSMSSFGSGDLHSVPSMCAPSIHFSRCSLKELVHSGDKF